MFFELVIGYTPALLLKSATTASIPGKTSWSPTIQDGYRIDVDLNSFHVSRDTHKMHYKQANGNWADCLHSGDKLTSFAYHRNLNKAYRIMYSSDDKQSGKDAINAFDVTLDCMGITEPLYTKQLWNVPIEENYQYKAMELKSSIIGSSLNMYFRLGEYYNGGTVDPDPIYSQENGFFITIADIMNGFSNSANIGRMYNLFSYAMTVVNSGEYLSISTYGEFKRYSGYPLFTGVFFQEVATAGDAASTTYVYPSSNMDESCFPIVCPLVLSDKIYLRISPFLSITFCKRSGTASDNICL